MTGQRYIATMTAATPYQIRDGLADWPLSRIVAEGVTLIVECMDCPYEAVWAPADVEWRFPRSQTKTLAEVAARMKCSRCTSNQIRIWRAAPGFVKPD